ncbi:hypothetical protein [Treponema sp. J25]|uniref:hypothetical protein n=1 Tax=Treponema sp. J25 TaxID=2094121 RepID=UPI0010430313|nr:hypothetical protein [Treponema sp. J25]
MMMTDLWFLLKGVLLSWEVWAVTLVVIFYFSLVLYVARLNRRPRSFLMLESNKPKKKRPKKEVSPSTNAETPEVEVE